MPTPRHALLLAGLSLVQATIVAAPVIAEPSRGQSTQVHRSRPCVDVEIAGERTPDYGCLTDLLRDTVEATKPIANVPPITVDGANPNTIGLITPTEVRQQYGPNFGKSAVPYRPQRNYPIPLVNGQR